MLSVHIGLKRRIRCVWRERIESCSCKGGYARRYTNTKRPRPMIDHSQAFVGTARRNDILFKLYLRCNRKGQGSRRLEGQRYIYVALPFIYFGPDYDRKRWVT